MTTHFYNLEDKPEISFVKTMPRVLEKLNVSLGKWILRNFIKNSESKGFAGLWEI